jgi:hypothetical protein
MFGSPNLRGQQVRTVSSSPSDDSKVSDVKKETSSSQVSTTETEEEWTEVVHHTGQIYYWNQVKISTIIHSVLSNTNHDTNYLSNFAWHVEIDYQPND